MFKNYCQDCGYILDNMNCYNCGLINKYYCKCQKMEIINLLRIIIFVCFVCGNIKIEKNKII